MNRRLFLGSLTAAGAIQASNTFPELRCTPDGTFTILTISDQHYTPQRDDHGIALTGKLIDQEKPDIVIANGDCLSGDRCHTATELETAISYVAAAMESKKVPWAITFGNHDQEHFPRTSLGKERVMEIYGRYPHNLNAGWARGIQGVGNKNLLVWNAAGTRPVFALWLVDSNNYTKNRADNYDWIHADQAAWYLQTSTDLEAKHGAKIPGLMFFHIPLQEFKDLAATQKFTGVRNESESTSAVNGGMFGAILERGDVKGVFCGHDHKNSYVGSWRGVCLGFDGVVGYGAYPHLQPSDPANGSVRSGRIFRITESDAAHFKTWVRFQNGSIDGEFTAA